MTDPAPPRAAERSAWFVARAALRSRLDGAEPVRLAFDLAGGFLAAWALYASARGFSAGIAGYDEGLVLTHTNAVLHGQLPHRDFYSAYAPANYWLLAAVWRVFGVSVSAARLVGFCVHLGIGCFASRLAARAGGRRFSWPTLGVVLTWLFTLNSVPYAWLLGLFWALATLELALVSRDTRSRGWSIAAGLAFGTLSGFRQDLFAYLGLSVGLLVALVALVGVVRRRWPSDWVPSSRQWGPFALGALVPIVCIWGPTFATAGFSRVASDLYFEQVRHIMPARDLPLPPLTSLVAVPPLPFALPAFFGRSFEAAIAWTLAAPFLAVAASLAWRKLEAKDRGMLALVGALAVAVLPQLLRRPDSSHALYTVTPALILAFGCLEAVATRFATRGGSPRTRSSARSSWFPASRAS
jgi:hypothetical protein